MRIVTSMVLAAALGFSALGSASALEGGIGFQPTPFIPDYNQPEPSVLYSSVCLAPPAACPVHYPYPIRAGKPCWCRDGWAVYTGGVTQPPYPSRPVYKD